MVKKIIKSVTSGESPTKGLKKKQRKRTRAPPQKALSYKLASKRIMKAGSKTNPILSDAYLILDQMFKEIPRNVMSQISIQAGALTRKKQKKQRGIKCIHVTNAVAQLLPDEKSRKSYLDFVQARLLQYHTAQEIKSEDE